MAWGDIKDPFGYEKFQVRSGNEPSASQFAKDRSQSWMDAGYPYPSVTPYWQKGFTTEASGVSPGAGNTRTYQMPGQWGEMTTPEYGGAYQDPESEMGLKGVGNLMNRFRNPEQEAAGYEKFQTRSGNEPGAFALQNQVAQEFMEGGYPYPSVTPYLLRGFTGEYPGISPGAGNTRTYQSPDQFSYSVVPNPNQTMPSFEDLIEMFGRGDEGIPMQEPDFGQPVQNPYEMQNQYIGQTGGPAGMGMTAYMDRPETQDRRPIYRDVSELGQTMGPAGMDMPSYMDRPGPNAYPEEDFKYPRTGRYGAIARLLKTIPGLFNEGGAVGLEPGIGSLMGRI